MLPDFQLPAEYAFVARALQQMDGVGKELDPEFEFIASVAPAIVELKVRRHASPCIAMQNSINSLFVLLTVHVPWHHSR